MKKRVVESYYEDKFTALEARVASLEEMYQSLLTDHTSSITSLQANVDANEQYERRETLIMYWPNLPGVASNENCQEIVRNIIRQHLRLNLCPLTFQLPIAWGKNIKIQQINETLYSNYVIGI